MVAQLYENGYLEGDCDDISTFYAAILKTLGYPTRFVAIRYRADSSGFEHVYTEGQDRASVWRVFDATVKPGTPLQAIERMVQEV
jgi:transglutaminase-like putative cysteine protease